MARNLLFDNVTCGRCGGSGRMPFAVYNGLCFKCHGAGAVLTKKGRAAQNFLDNLRLRNAEDFKVGDLFYDGGCPGMTAARFYVIEKIEVEGDKVILHGAGKNGAFNGYAIHTSKGQKLRAGFDAATKDAQKAQALAYQATLTKAGTVNKKLAKEAC